MLDLYTAYRPVTIGRHTFFVQPSTGRVRPAVSGGDGPADDGASGGSDDGGQAAASFTQADMDRVAGAARAEARRAATNDLATQLGVTPDEAKKIIDEHQAAREAQQSEVQRAQAAAQAAEARATAAETQAARFGADNTVRLALIAAGMAPAGVDDGLRLVDVDPADDIDAVTAKVAALAGRLPALFTTDGSTTPAPPAGFTPPRPPAGGNKTGNKTMAERGREALLAAGIRPRDTAA